MSDPVKTSKKRLVVAFIFILIGFLLVISRIIYLGVFPGKVKFKFDRVEERGEILDCNYNTLATSLEVYSIFCNPEKVPPLEEEKIRDLSIILNISERNLKNIFQSKKSFVWLKRKVDLGTFRAIRDMKIEGINYNKEYKRIYPNKRLASHVLGIVGIDNVGLEGSELFYERYLNSGHTFSDNQKNFNIVLSIDKNIQYIVETELKNAFARSKAKRGTAIVMDPGTGYILAFANVPDFDPNQYQQSSLNDRKNTAIIDAFEPGSIFKIFTTACILSENPVKKGYKFFCPGYINIGKEKLSCWARHGEIGFDDVIKQSCNVGMIRSIFKVSSYRFYDYLRDFSIGHYTGIDLPGEGKGILRPPKQWPLFSKAAVSIGQEVSTTSIQLITAACAIFNGGKVMEPKIAKAIIYPDGTIYKDFNPVAIRQVITSSIAHKVAQLLIGVVQEGGTGELAYIKGYSIAGKTGTGEIYDRKEKKYFKNRVNASFIGFIPAQKARYAILVTLHEPRSGLNTGGAIAAPVFKKIVEKLIAYKPIPAEKRVITPPYIKNNYIKKIQLTDKKYIPDLRGKNMREILQILSAMDVKPNLIGSGVASRQYPPKGTRVYKGMVVTVWFEDPIIK
ncbi:MAG: PASTA domain-containing protein [Spirochaetes bacterium]|nr:PASTA domain-containing protein [Spirochaetota bacterium]